LTFTLYFSIVLLERTHMHIWFWRYTIFTCLTL